MLSTVFLVVAIILFVLAALSVALGDIALVPLGLAFFAAAHLPWGSITVNNPPPK